MRFASTRSLHSRPGAQHRGGFFSAVWALLFAVMLLPAVVEAGTPEEDLVEAEKAYERSDYRRVIALVAPLLEPKIELSSQNHVLQAHRLLALSYLFEKNATLAEKSFLAILSMRPDYRMDPLLDPVAALDFFEEVKRRNAERILVFQQREREAEKKRQEELRRKAEEELRKIRSLAEEPDLIERTVVQRSYWINFLPFGAGQFQNGDTKKGLVLLFTQTALGALSLGTALSLRITYPDGQVPADEWDRAQALSVTQVTAGALFLGAVLYGVIDALVNYEGSTMTEKRTRRKPRAAPTSRTFLIPSFDPSAPGLGLGLNF